MTHLPLVEPHARAHTYCAFCPKLCRFACPVSTAQASETTTPWGKMTALHHVAGGRLPLDPDHAASFWACTGCMRCRTFCDHGNEVAAALGAGRAEAMKAGAAPAAARELRDAHEARAARSAEAARATLGDRLTAPAATVYAPGCTRCAVAPDSAHDGVTALEALLGTRVRVEASGCCGLPLLEAGDPDGFVRSARTFVERVRAADRVVFDDPGCLFAMSVIAPMLGVTHGTAMEHTSQLAARHLDQLPTTSLPVLRYHDACKLGRGLGVYDEPRAVLERIAGAPPGELDQRRDRAECSGAGGQLPTTDRGTARAIAAERAADHERAGGGTLVTACPASEQALRRTGMEVVGFTSLLKRALADG